MNGFYKGVAAGMVLGTAATMVLFPMSGKTNRTIRKNTGRAIRAVGGVIDNLQNLWQ